MAYPLMLLNIRIMFLSRVIQPYGSITFILLRGSITITLLHGSITIMLTRGIITIMLLHEA